MPPFTFDFTLKIPNMKYVPKQEQTIARTLNDTGNNCPYPIPTVQEIMKMIDNSSYRVNKSKLISDVFECGAIAISNKVDFTKYDEREKRYQDIIKTYQPSEQKLITDIFTKIFCLCSSVVYDDGVFAETIVEYSVVINNRRAEAKYFSE